MSTIDRAAFENLVACRDLLLFTLTDQSRPPEDLLEPLDSMIQLLFRRIDELRTGHGFPDPDMSVHDPRVIMRFDGTDYLTPTRPFQKNAD
jgi:hypothetical protein